MKRKAPGILCVILILSLLSGCTSFPVTFLSGRSYMMTCGQDSLTEAEVKLIALQYKCRFENYYKDLLGDRFWNTSLSDGLTFEEYVKEYFIYRECKALLYLSASGSTAKIDEKYDRVFREAAERFYSTLTKDELRYTGASESDVESLMRRYALASKMIASELSGSYPEVSEEESRVADVQIIHVRDLTLARELSARIENGESFLTLAQEHTVDSEIDYSVFRGELISELDDLVFSMEDYDISDIVSVGDDCYIVRMVNSYDVLLSGKHRDNLLAEKRFLSWESLLTEQEGKDEIRRNERAYESISLSRSGDFPYVDLFSAIPGME